MDNSILNRFIEKSTEIHSGKYDYSKVIYINTNSKVIISCPIHGDFLQTPKNHQRGHGCKKCSLIEKSKLFSNSLDYFILKSNQVHRHKYDYSKSIYINNKTKISIICKEHGEFKMNPSHHYNGHGCPSCSNNYRRKNEEFIKECLFIHNNKYIYKSEFKSLKGKMLICCPIHGDFTQTSGHHLIGHGCPICSSSHGEKYIIEFLESNNIKYQREKTFEDCLSPIGRRLKFDFYIPEQNICIEYDGLQHFKPLEYFGGVKEFEKIKNNDKIKNIYCLDNGINLIRIKYLRPSSNNKNRINQILTQKIKINMEKTKQN